MMTIAAPLVCTCVVSGVDTLPLALLRIDLPLDFDLLLPDGGAVAGPPVDDGGSEVFTSADIELLC